MKWGTGHFGADETSSQREHMSARVTVCVCMCLLTCMCVCVCPLTTARLHKQDNKALNMHSSPSPAWSRSRSRSQLSNTIAWQGRRTNGKRQMASVQAQQDTHTHTHTYTTREQACSRRGRGSGNGSCRTKLRKVVGTYVRANQVLHSTSHRGDPLSGRDLLPCTALHCAPRC